MATPVMSCPPTLVLCPAKCTHSHRVPTPFLWKNRGEKWGECTHLPAADFGVQGSGVAALPSSVLSHPLLSGDTSAFSKERKKWSESRREIPMAPFHMMVPFLNLS